MSAAIRAEVQEILDRVRSGEERPKRVRAERSQKVPGGPPRGANTPPSKYDRKKIKALFDSGLFVSQIAAKTGASRSTVSLALNEMGVPPEGRRGPAQQQEKCQRGHSMAVHAKPNSNGRGRYCSECKRARERVKR